MLINWIEKLSSSELNLNLEKCFREATRDFLLRQHLKLFRFSFVAADLWNRTAKRGRSTKSVENSRFHFEIKQSRATFIRNLGEIHWKPVYNLIMRRKIFSQDFVMTTDWKWWIHSSSVWKNGKSLAARVSALKRVKARQKAQLLWFLRGDEKW